jgi:hypothetical protein
VFCIILLIKETGITSLIFPSPEASMPINSPFSSTTEPPLFPGKLLAVVCIRAWGYLLKSENEITFPGL